MNNQIQSGSKKRPLKKEAGIVKRKKIFDDLFEKRKKLKKENTVSETINILFQSAPSAYNITFNFQGGSLFIQNYSKFYASCDKIIWHYHDALKETKSDNLEILCTINDLLPDSFKIYNTLGNSTSGLEPRDSIKLSDIACVYGAGLEKTFYESKVLELSKENFYIKQICVPYSSKEYYVLTSDYIILRMSSTTLMNCEMQQATKKLFTIYEPIPFPHIVEKIACSKDSLVIISNYNELFVMGSNENNELGSHVNVGSMEVLNITTQQHMVINDNLLKISKIKEPLCIHCFNEDVIKITSNNTCFFFTLKSYATYILGQSHLVEEVDEYCIFTGSIYNISRSTSQEQTEPLMQLYFTISTKVVQLGALKEPHLATQDLSLNTKHGKNCNLRQIYLFHYEPNEPMPTYITPISKSSNEYTFSQNEGVIVRYKDFVISENCINYRSDIKGYFAFIDFNNHLYIKTHRYKRPVRIIWDCKKYGYPVEMKATPLELMISTNKGKVAAITIGNGLKEKFEIEIISRETFEPLFEEGFNFDQDEYHFIELNDSNYIIPSERLALIEEKREWRRYMMCILCLRYLFRTCPDSIREEKQKYYMGTNYSMLNCSIYGGLFTKFILTKLFYDYNTLFQIHFKHLVPQNI